MNKPTRPTGRSRVAPPKQESETRSPFPRSKRSIAQSQLPKMAAPEKPVKKAPVSQKIQKILADRGFGSRREIEEWLTQGRIALNGTVAKLGDRAKVQDQLFLDGRLIKPLSVTDVRAKCPRVLMYYKPEGEVCTQSDPEGRPTVFDSLPRVHKQRWIAMGRLDLNTSGLLLFTNDGELANALLHPSAGIEREYAVRVRGEVSHEALERLRRGVRLEDGMGHFETVKDAGGEGSNHWYHVVIKEGRNREVRRLWESQGCIVSRLIRVRFGPITLPVFLKRGRYIELENDKVQLLLAAAQKKS